MDWNLIYQDMAFYPYKTDMADYNQLKDAISVLYGFLRGQAKEYELYDALGYLEQKFGSRILKGSNIIRKSANIEDDTLREKICYEGIRQIELYLKTNLGARIS